MKFKKLYDQYAIQADERQSPLSIEIWWRGFNHGREVRHLHSRPREWRWFIAKKDSRSRALLNIERRYQAWRLKQTPRKRYTQSDPRIIANPVGERIRHWEDNPVDVGECESDDGFVVHTDEDSGDEEENSHSDEDGSQASEQLFDLRYESSSQIKVIGAIKDDGNSLSSSFPSVSELIRSRSKARHPSETLRTPSCSTSPAPHPHENSSPILKSINLRGRSLQSPGQMKPRTPSTDSSSDDFEEPIISSIRKKNQEILILSHFHDSREDLTDSDEPIVSSSQEKIRKTLAMSKLTATKNDSKRLDQLMVSPNRKKRHQKPATVQSTGSGTDTTDSDEPIVPSTRKKRQKTPIIILGSEQDDSDNLPLIPRLQSSMKLKRAREVAFSSDVEDQKISQKSKVSGRVSTPAKVRRKLYHRTIKTS